MGCPNALAALSIDFLLSFLVCRSRKIDSNNSTIRNRLLMITLISPETFPSPQSLSKSAFTRLTSSLTEVLSRFATAQ